MFYYVLVMLPVLGASSTLGTESPPSNQGDTSPSPHYESRIVNAGLADIDRYPHTARYTWISKVGTIETCHGAIVSDQYVITAAQCLFEIENPGIIRLGMGAEYLENLIKVPVEEIIIHPDYFPEYREKPNPRYDIAFMRTERIKFSDTVKAIKLPRKAAEVSQFVHVTAWGADKNGDIRLMMAEFLKLQNDWCKDYGFMNKELFCAGGLEEGLCKGDAGAPAIQLRSEFQDGRVLHGITVFQKECGTGLYPAVFVKLSSAPIYNFIARILNITNS